MKAMIFAAGLGKRLQPETDYKPKALVEVCGKPMLGHVIDRLKDAGVDFLVINVHHFANQIIDYLNANNSFGLEIHISDESEQLLDTGGGIVKAARLLADSAPVIVHNADILTDLDLACFYKHHLSDGSDITLFVDSNRNSSRGLLFDDKLKMHGWINTEAKYCRPDNLSPELYKRYSFNGIHVLSQNAIRDIASHIDDGAAFSITDYYIDSCERLCIKGYQKPDDIQWFDIGSPEKLKVARNKYRL